ncbi:MAG TPA: MtrB/PioB family outer membrane beta-barrel protein, partial [Rhodocyclaceae bacterium]
SANLTYSLAKTNYATSLGYVNATIGASGTTPDIRSETTQFSLVGDYHIDKPSAVVLGYAYQKLSANDYFYNGYQYGYTPTSLIPTNQQVPTYNVNRVFAAYRYSFR